MIKSALKLFSLVFGNQTGDGTTFHPLKTCPECGSKLMRTAVRAELHESQTESHTPAKDGDLYNSSLRNENTEWLCPNPDCPAEVRRGLVHWCSPEVMDIAGGDAVLVAKLVGKGLACDVAELYGIQVSELAALEGMDKDSAQKFFAAITVSTKRDVWRLLFGLGIPLVGTAKAQALGKGFPTVDAVFAAGVPRLMKDGGVNEAVAQSIVRWHSDSVNRKLLKRLEKLGVNLKSESYCAAPAKIPGA